MSKQLLVILIGAFLLFGLGAWSADKGPDKLVFDAKNGNVTYDHAKHVEREKGDCKVCHPKLFPQSYKKQPLNFKTGMHKIAERQKTSCGACHVAGGQAFETKGNCKKCHGNAG